MAKHQFLWLDLEMTGLDPLAPGAAILEWAIILAADDRDGDMLPVDEFTGLIAYPGANPTAAMDPYVVAMHTKNGLLVDLASGAALPVEEVDALLAGMAAELCPDGKIPLAGGSVHFDLAWARVHLPRFAARLHHRVLDVSTLKAAERAWFGEFRDIKADAHRALPDIRASLAEAREWRRRHAFAMAAAAAKGQD